MFPLRISPEWALQIQKIRDANTDETHLIRFDNGFYRICRDKPHDFSIELQPSVAGQRGVVLNLRQRDLYVTHIDGKPFVNYAQTIDMLSPEAMTLDGAIMSLRRETGTRLFELQSLVVLCVAESLRNDHVADRVGQMIRVAMSGLRGVPAQLPMQELVREVRAWGQTSEAIVRALTPAARTIVLQDRSTLTPLQRRFSERVDLSQVDADLQAFARSLKVIKRPG